jgi:hypothetical protein
MFVIAVIDGSSVHSKSAGVVEITDPLTEYVFYVQLQHLQWSITTEHREFIFIF